jgi:hypothetical protein
MSALAVRPSGVFGFFSSKPAPDSVEFLVGCVKQNKKVCLIWKRVEERFQERIVILRVPRKKAPFGARMEFRIKNLFEKDLKIPTCISEPRILIADDLNIPSQKAAIIFELFNLYKVDEHALLDRRAILGVISKEKYVEESDAIEGVVHAAWQFVLRECVARGIFKKNDQQLQFYGPKSGFNEDQDLARERHKEADALMWEELRLKGGAHPKSKL